MTLPAKPHDLQFSTLTTPIQLDAVADEWRRLLAECSDANTFLTPEWLLSWWNAYSPTADLCTIAASAGGQLVGLAPMMMKREARFRMPVRCLRFIGDGTYESDHMNFVAHPDYVPAIQRQLLDELLRLPWNLAIFANIPESSTLAAELDDWAGKHRMLVDRQLAPCPARRIPETFDALLASMPSRFRTAVRAARRNLAAAHQVEFGLHDNPAEFDAALNALFENHESRWRAKGQSGVFLNPRRREFYKTLTRRLHERNSLRFFYLKLDGRIVAQEYCFAHGRTVYLLQEGFDFALAQLNLGNALRGYVFEYLIQNKYEVYDFLAGMSRNKKNWSDTVTNDVTITVVRPSLKGRLIHNAPRVIEYAKNIVRPLVARLRAARSAATTGQNRP